jgi:hypothetical protein
MLRLHFTDFYIHLVVPMAGFGRRRFSVFVLAALE